MHFTNRSYANWVCFERTCCATNPKQTEASKEKESFGKMILPGVIAGLGLCVVLTFVSLATSSNTDN